MICFQDACVLLVATKLLLMQHIPIRAELSLMEKMMQLATSQTDGPNAAPANGALMLQEN